MAVDLLLDLPDELIDADAVAAAAGDTTGEELMRRVLIEGAGEIYVPLTAADIADTSRRLVVAADA